MKEIILTCPFTGVEFKAIEYLDGKIVCRHAITGEEIHMNWNSSINRYNIVKGAFKHINTVTMSEAAEILGVSRQRISKIAAEQTIMPHTIAGNTVFILDDILGYKEKRKVGAPCKE